MLDSKIPTIKNIIMKGYKELRKNYIEFVRPILDLFYISIIIIL